MAKRSGEAALVHATLDYLAARRIFAWRANSGSVTAEYKGKKRFFRFSGVKGLADVIGVFPDGRFLAIELKRPGNKPSADQQSFLDRVTADGGIAFWADSIDTVMSLIEIERSTLTLTLTQAK